MHQTLGLCGQRVHVVYGDWQMFLPTENCTSCVMFLRQTACHRGWSPAKPAPKAAKPRAKHNTCICHAHDTAIAETHINPPHTPEPHPCFNYAAVPSPPTLLHDPTTIQPSIIMYNSTLPCTTVSNLLPRWQPSLQLESPFLWLLLSMCSSSESNTPARKSGKSLTKAEHVSQWAVSGSCCGSYAFVSARLFFVLQVFSIVIGGAGEPSLGVCSLEGARIPLRAGDYYARGMGDGWTGHSLGGPSQGHRSPGLRL